MQTARKVAIAANVWTAYVYRLMLGGLSYAAVHPNLVTRDFRFSRDRQNRDKPEAALTQLLHWNPDGLFGFFDTEPLERLLQSLPEPRPMVNMCAIKPMPGVAVVVGRLAAMMELAVNHLRQQGLRSLAYLAVEDWQQHPYWSNTFNRIARPANPALATHLELISLSVIEDPYAPVAPVPARLAAWLRQLPKPVGVFCASLGGGGYLIRVCRELGLRVPEDVAVVGSDDEDLAIASSPTLTTVNPAAHAIGREAMQLLDQMMNGKPAPMEPVRLDALDLQVRESTGSKRPQICDIAAALDYIARHACHGVSVEQVMKETQRVSKGTFHKHFLATTGQTPGNAIRQRQVEEARRLLATTQISITTIAEQCGFCDIGNFSRGFRVVQGMSPRDYRKQAQAQRVKRDA